MQLRDEEALIYQNLPELRSLPTIAHSHVFLRPLTPVLARGLERRRAAWRARSPWLKAQSNSTVEGVP